MFHYLVKYTTRKNSFTLCVKISLELCNWDGPNVILFSVEMSHEIVRIMHCPHERFLYKDYRNIISFDFMKVLILVWGEANCLNVNIWREKKISFIWYPNLYWLRTWYLGCIISFLRMNWTCICTYSSHIKKTFFLFSSISSFFALA